MTFSSPLEPDSPLITVLMTVFNAAPFLRGSIECILTQTFGDFEFLIIDDGSTDESLNIIRSFRDPRIRLIANPHNKGQTLCLNQGLALARGKFIARQDADDWSDPGRLALQSAFLRDHPDVILVGAQGWLINARGDFLSRMDLPLRAAGIRWFHVFDNAFLHAAVLFRRSLVDQCGGYDESFIICQDYELWARAIARFPVANLPQRLVRYRMHGASLSQSRLAETWEEIARVVAAGLAARFPGTGVSREEAFLLSTFRTRIPEGEVEAFMRIFSRLLADAERPAVDEEERKDLHRTLAIQYVKIGYNLLPAHRLKAATFYLRALRSSPSYFLGLPWLRIAALALFGDLARKSYLALMRILKGAG